MTWTKTRRMNGGTDTQQRRLVTI